MTRRPNNELTSTERRVLDAYAKLSKKLDKAPSLSELAAELGDLSRSGVGYIRDRLAEKGHLTPSRTTIIRSKLTAKGRRAG